MCDKESPGEWSVVLYESSLKNLNEFFDKAQNAFGKRGLDCFSLSFGNANEHLPAELCRNLSKEKAEHIAQQLNIENTVVKAEPTAGLTDLRHKTEDVWATRSTETYCFTEIDGLICSLGAINARENIAHMRNRFPDAAPWEIERAENHDHIFYDWPDGDYIKGGEIKLEHLMTALRQAYPDVAFTISIRPGDILSFWQTTEDSPKGSCIPDMKNESGESWCHKCKRRQKFEKIDYVDDRHPNVEWGECQVCGERIITQNCLKLIHI